MRLLFIPSTIIVVAILVFGVSSRVPVVAQVMTSGSYRIQSDSLNVSGGLGTSTNYTLESTSGEIATGESTSTNYTMQAGYQQMQEVFISMSAAADVVLPNIPGITGGTATGSNFVVVTTDSPAGYQLTIRANQSPAMQSAVGTIADYVPTGAVPDFTFTNDPAEAQFGFSPEGTDIAVRYQDSGGVCGVVGSDTSLRCYDGLNTSARVIAETTNANHPAGATTTLRFQLALGGSIVVPAGTYIATTTITALPL